MEHLNEEMKSEIQALMDYSMKEKVSGCLSNMRFQSLAYKYPWQAFFFWRTFNNNSMQLRHSETALKSKFEEIKRFILLAPLSPNEQVLMETLLGELQRIVERELNLNSDL